MIKKLRKKFIWINMSCVTLILIIVFGILCFSNYHHMQQEIDDNLSRTLMMQQKEEIPKFEFNDHKDDKAFGMHNAFRVETDLNGTIISIHAMNLDVDQESLQNILSTMDIKDKQKGILQSQSLAYQIKQTSSNYQIAFVDISANLKDMKNLIITSMIVGTFAFLAFLLLSFILSNWALRPVQHAWDQQKQFVADASHELKTPLTVILADSDILLAHANDTIDHQGKWINSIQSEAQRMKKLVESLLFLAKSDANRLPVEFQNINFSDIVWNCILPFESIAYEHGIHLHSEIENDLYVSGNEAQLKQVMLIFLDNACKYTPAKGKISIHLKKNNEKLVCKIHNTGSYISKEEQAHIFERFYRCDKARVHEGGYGLGLPIAKSIMDAHHGQIQVESNEVEGCCFQLILPLKNG